MNNANYIRKLEKKLSPNHIINDELFIQHDVKRGLRDINGKGVLVGLTNISDIVASTEKAGIEGPDRGRLLYRGYDVEDIVKINFSKDRLGFEEICYLLMVGELPTSEELKEFNDCLSNYKSLPDGFTRDIILSIPCKDMMNLMSRSILTLYSLDENPDDISIENVLRQSIQLIGNMPAVAVHGFATYAHAKLDRSLVIHNPMEELSIAENILHMIRPDSKFTPLEANLLDISLILHAEHGGGNNSSFTTRVVTSSGTDTYSAISSAVCSLKGPRHGGANVKVVQMFDDLKKNITDWKDESQIEEYLLRILNKNAFDNSGLIYGMGHAVYSISDPRAELIKSAAKELAKEKGLSHEFDLYERVEKIGTKAISEKRKIYKGVSANVDFYSGFVYSMLGIPIELFTPLFAIARMPGWCAHRLEELVGRGKIIRPAYKSVGEKREYSLIENR